MHTRSSSAFNVLVQNVHATMLQINKKIKKKFQKSEFRKETSRDVFKFTGKTLGSVCAQIKHCAQHDITYHQ